jgi:hypothetical protein
VNRPLDLSVGRIEGRDLPYDHETHAGRVRCSSCHTEGLQRSAAEVDCASCHQDHHEPEVRCASCHVGLTEEPHTVDAHRGCNVSGCHQLVPFEGVPRERNFCVTCHQDMEDHREGERCESCHQLPEPVSGGGTP